MKDSFVIGIKHVFHERTPVPEGDAKTDEEVRGFQHLQRNLAYVNALKNVC